MGVRDTLFNRVVDAREPLLDRVVLLRDPLLIRIVLLALKQKFSVIWVQKDRPSSTEGAIARSVHRRHRGFTIHDWTLNQSLGDTKRCVNVY